MATIRVRATQRGYHRWMRQPGEEFEIDERHYTHHSKPGGWMEKVEPPTDGPDAPGATAAPGSTTGELTSTGLDSPIPAAVPPAAEAPPVDNDHVAPGATPFETLPPAGSSEPDLRDPTIPAEEWL